MHWLLLFLAIGLEVSAQMCLKLANGWSKLLPSILALLFFPSSFLAYSFAISKIKLSHCYAIWSGLGITMVTLIGWLVLKEPMPPMRWFFIGVILAGIMGLQLTYK